uniref:UTP1m n=1 Tax=Chlamydomonas reinhardtii TaxID=3055 RepID=D5LB17_CHLRE|nr:UTP1m [Chlamydomonas reinhardtii]
MNYVFSNLLGAPYRGGTLLIQNNELLTPVGNRVGQVNLTESTSKCLPFENLTQIRVLCASPDGTLLVSVDKDGRALLINRKRQTLLHHFSFKGPVACARFSPDGRYIAVAVGRLVQVWCCPTPDKQMNPMQLHRTYGQCHSDVLDIAWSPDGAFLAAASKDITLRVFSLNPIPGYEPPTLCGHKDALLGVFFASPAMLAKGTADGGEAPCLYSLSVDGSLHAWTYAASAAYTLDNLAAPVAKRKREAAAAEAAEKQRRLEEGEEEEEAAGEEEGEGDAARRKSGRRASTSSGTAAGEEEQAEEGGRGAEEATKEARPFPYLAGGKWYLTSKHYFNQRGSRVSSYAHHAASGLLAVGFSGGVFDLYSLPDFANLHTLSVGQERITSLAFNDTGDWLAVGCARLGQLLVWEWRSETYVLKQQGHYHDITTTAFSPDGALIATGADDCKVKVFQQSSGFCFVTFSDHSAPVTAVTFLPSGHALLSASLDGTVRAWDLVRYRNFRTLTAPSPVQFGSLAVDPAGEVVCAGTVDTFQIYVWSLKTGRLLDVLAGHEGPVSALAFSPITSLLASGSWDRTVRTWDVYGGGGGGGSAGDVLDHRHDVLALAMRPDGRQLAAATLDGSIYLWDPVEGVLEGTIEGRRDIRGGRLQGDRRTADNSSAGASFNSLAYSADGALLLAGGNSKFVCVYDVSEKLLLRRFQLSHNRSLDGVLDTLNSKNMTDAGPLQLINHNDDDDDEALELLPPSTDLAAAADVPGTTAGKRPAVRCRCVALSPTGRVWAAAATEGLLLYGLDTGVLFDPTDLTEDLTPAAAHAALAGGTPLRALTIALRLGEPELVRHVILATPPRDVGTTAAGLPAMFVPTVLAALAEAAADCPHLEFLLGWVRAVCSAHGAALQAAAGGGAPGTGVAARLAAAGVAGGQLPASSVLPALRSLQKVLGRLHTDLAAACEGNVYMLDYLASVSGTAATGEPANGEQPAEDGSGGAEDDDDEEEEASH